MIYTSLAVLALSASAALPFQSPVHLHPKMPDTRISVTLYNKAISFCDVKVADRIYTVMPHHTLDIKAPAGTIVYASSRTLEHKRGDAILEIKPELDKQLVNID
jgi:hypothetical protein